MFVPSIFVLIELVIQGNAIVTTSKIIALYVLRAMTVEFNIPPFIAGLGIEPFFLVKDK